jgi:hypothetical protein
MKYFWPQMAWFCTGAILGQFTESVLFPVWAKFGLLMPIGHWVASFGYESLSWCWLLVYIWFVSWLIVALVSVIGGIVIKSRPLLNMFLFGVGFAFAPLALYAYLVSRVPNLADYIQHLVIVGIAVLCASLGHQCGVRFRRASQRRSQSMTDESHPTS